MYGEDGLLDMPSAHMSPDGNLWVSLSGTSTAQRISLGFQILPWLEGSFRYSRISKISDDRASFDRSFGLKVRLLQENYYRPDISLGIRDIVGTGIYSAEYLTLSKHFGDVDITSGLGWGRLASDGDLRNPFSLLFKSFDTRSRPIITGGNFNPGAYFHGPDAGLFGGVIWHTPIKDLSIISEYSSDRYTRESANHAINIRAPVNVGLSYQLLDSLSVTAGWFYGSAFGANVTLSADPTTPVFPGTIDPSPTNPISRTDSEQASAVANYVYSVEPLTRSLPIHIGSNQALAVTRTTETELENTLVNGSNIEIQGGTLLADFHAHGSASVVCHKLAALAGNSDIDTVAVTDLDESGSAAVCATSKNRFAPAQTLNSWSKAQLVADNMSGDAPPDPAVPLDMSAKSDKSITTKIVGDASAQSISVVAVELRGSEAFIYYNNQQYQLEAEAIGRLARIAMTDLPAEIEVFHFVPVIFGQAVQDIRILRSPLERMFETRGNISEIEAALAIRPAPLDVPVLDSELDKTYPVIDWHLGPAIRQGYFDPKAPYRVQVYAALSGSVEFFQGFSLEGEIDGSIYNSFSRNSPADSALPHVRTDTSKYLTIGASGVSNLDAVYRTRLAPDIFAEIKAGYVEDMFAGGGGQLLWRPEGSRWAFGADAYQVWQRNFDRLFGLQHYHVLTGHVSAYYRSPWYDLDFAIHAGRYLAGDYGATLEITREFATGVEVGAFATFTNVPFSKFGEGSFDKGIIVRIPLEWNLPFHTQTAFDLLLRPLQRDGGQRLFDDDSLFDETKRTSFGEIIDHVQEIENP